MRSQLTRVVFRKLLANEPIAYQGCLRRAGAGQRVLSRPSAVLYPHRSQRRTFFNLFPKAAKDISDADYDPGIEKMMEFAKRKRLDARLPPAQEMARAFRRYFANASATERPVEDEQMQYILQTFEYLQQEGKIEGLGYPFLEQTLSHIATYSTRRDSEVHRRFATLVYEEGTKLWKASNDENSTNWVLFRLYAEVMSKSGGTSTARDVLTTKLTVPGLLPAKWKPSERTTIARVFAVLLTGFSFEHKEEDMVSLIDRGLQRIPSLSESITLHRVMAVHYADLDKITQTKHWYDQYMEAAAKRSNKEGMWNVEIHESVLRLCLRKQEIEWGQTIIRHLTSRPPAKEVWDLLFEWAAGTGKGVDEVDRMMDVMERQNEDKSTGISPDVDTINRLVEFAITRNDPYMAERFIQIGRKRNIEPNAKTLVLQMDYRLSVNDVDGALIAYKHLQSHDLSDNKDVPTVNRLLCAMCASGRHDFDSIMNVAADLSDRQARFEATTVSALAVLHLSRGELHDVIDLLNTHTFRYSIAERKHVRDSIIAYCLNPATPTADAWEAYNIFRQVFDETPREQRTQMMNEFFRRRRPDMSVHVFNHMRTHTRADTIPTTETYITCLVGIARLRDEESLENVHNQLKLDWSIEPDTRVLNALMLAYTSVEKSQRALGFWDDITASKEGPTMNSIHLALKACERAPWGDRKARGIWQQLSRAGIELDADLWASYAGALAGNGNVSGTIEVLEQALEKGTLGQMNAMM